MSVMFIYITVFIVVLCSVTQFCLFVLYILISDFQL